MPEKIRGFDKFGLEHSVSSARDSKQVSAEKTAEELLEAREITTQQDMNSAEK